MRFQFPTPVSRPRLPERGDPLTLCVVFPRLTTIYLLFSLHSSSAERNLLNISFHLCGKLVDIKSRICMIPKRIIHPLSFQASRTHCAANVLQSRLLKQLIYGLFFPPVERAVVVEAPTPLHGSFGSNILTLKAFPWSSPSGGSLEFRDRTESRVCRVGLTLFTVRPFTVAYEGNLFSLIFASFISASCQCTAENARKMSGVTHFLLDEKSSCFHGNRFVQRENLVIVNCVSSRFPWLVEAPS